MDNYKRKRKIFFKTLTLKRAAMKFVKERISKRPRYTCHDREEEIAILVPTRTLLFQSSPLEMERIYLTTDEVGR